MEQRADAAGVAVGVGVVRVAGPGYSRGCRGAPRSVTAKFSLNPLGVITHCPYYHTGGRILRDGRLSRLLK
jgi:hypothetical protein